MERVAFLIEQTGERIGCLLNPESIVRRRTAGLVPGRSVSGLLTGVGLSDDQMIYTGGGTTELNLDLLFDVSVAGSTITAEDVRDLTGPLWALTENFISEDGYGKPPLARFIWGKSWNVLGVIAAVAERLEYFTPEGTPRRSWLRLKMLRVAEPPAQAQTVQSSNLLLATDSIETARANGITAPDEEKIYEVIGDSEEGGSSEPLYNIATRFGLDPAWWRLIAERSGIDDPLRIKPGTQLQIP